MTDASSKTSVCANLVERLRDRDAVVMAGLFHAIPAMHEAADEITRLTAELEIARKALEEIISTHANFGVSPMTVNRMSDLARAALQGQPK